MSSAFGLVKFKTTGNIYYCCYNGTSDIMNPYICTPEECYDEATDAYWAITYCEALDFKYKTWKFPNNVTDLDEIEIYSDYGGGFYWSGTGSESIKMIKNYLNPWEECYEDMKDGKPEWVINFLDRLEKE